MLSVLLLRDPAVCPTRSSPRPHVWHVWGFAKIRCTLACAFWTLNCGLNGMSSVFGIADDSTWAHSFALDWCDRISLNLDWIATVVCPAIGGLAWCRQLRRCFNRSDGSDEERPSHDALWDFDCVDYATGRHWQIYWGHVFKYIEVTSGPIVFTLFKSAWQ